MIKQISIKKINVLNLTILCLFLIELFTCSSSFIKSLEGQLDMIVPGIIISSNALTIIQLLMLLSLFLYMLYIKEGKIDCDLMSLFLLIRIVLGCFPIVYHNFVSSTLLNYGNYYMRVLELILYVSSYNLYSEVIEKSYYKMIRALLLIVAFETIVQSVVGIMPSCPYTSLWYKSNLNIPIGSSNTLAAMIVPMAATILFGLKNETHKKLAIVEFVFLTSAIFLTKSRFGMLIMLGAISFYMMTMKNMNRKIVVIKILILIASIVCLGVLINLYAKDILTVIVGYSSEVTSGGLLNKLSSGRMDYFGSYLQAIMDSPIIGNGPNYAFSRSHNIIIDVLYESGIIGFTLFLTSIILNFKMYYLIQIKENRELQFVFLLILFCLIESMGEITFFTNFAIDLIFLPSFAFFSAKLKEMNSMEQQ